MDLFDLSKWSVKWIKVLLVVVGFMLLFQFIELLTNTASEGRLYRFIMVMVGSALFAYVLYGLKFAYDRDAKKKDGEGEEDDE